MTVIMTAQLLQFGGSLLAILALAWAVHRLDLGGERRIRDEAHARELASEAEEEFMPVDVAVDGAGRAALLRDSAGQIMLLRMHGSKTAARILGMWASARIIDNDGQSSLEVNSGERRFGNANLDIENATGWMQAIGVIASNGHA